MAQKLYEPASKWLKAALPCALLGGLLAGCTAGKAEPPVSTGGSADPVVIQVFAQQDANVDLRNNAFSNLLERKFNIRFEWEIIPFNAAKEKRQISLAGGEYADTYLLTAFIDQFSQTEVLRYGKEGVLLPLNDLIEAYAPNIKQAFAANPLLRALNTAPDGNIYGLASYSECYHCSYPNKLWINEKWLKALGLAMPATTEELREVLKAFKERDPNGNGLADEVPLSGSTEEFGVHVVPFLMNGFIYDDDRNYLLLQDGKVGFAADKPEWREGLAYIKSLYEDGLIDPGAFIQDSESFRRLGDNADAPILGAAAAMHPLIFTEVGLNARGSDYAPVPPLTGPHASFAVHNEGGIFPGAKFVITNKAGKEAQEALIKIADYIYTPEGQANADAGLEGFGWRKPRAGEQALGANRPPVFASLASEERQSAENTGWLGMGHFYMPREYRDSWVQSENIYDIAGYERRLAEATKLYDGKGPKEIFPAAAVWIDPDAADEVGLLQTNLKNYVDQNTLQFITGDKNLQEDWEAYVKELGNMRLGRYLEIMQLAYDSYRAAIPTQ